MLDILIQEGSVSLTAQRLKLTQPAISNALARLRAHFDDELFVLMDRKMVPTPLCRSLAEPVRRIMSELSLIAAARAEFDPTKTDRTVTIVCSDYVFLVFLSRAIRELAAVAPGVCISRALLTSENMERTPAQRSRRLRHLPGKADGRGPDAWAPVRRHLFRHRLAAQFAAEGRAAHSAAIPFPVARQHQHRPKHSSPHRTGIPRPTGDQSEHRGLRAQFHQHR